MGAKPVSCCSGCCHSPAPAPARGRDTTVPKKWDIQRLPQPARGCGKSQVGVQRKRRRKRRKKRRRKENEEEEEEKGGTQ